MRTRLVILAAIAIGLVTIVACQNGGDGKVSSEPPSMTLTIDRNHAVPGDVIRIRHSCRTSEFKRIGMVAGLSYRVKRLAFFHRAQNRMVFDTRLGFTPESPSSVFQGLPEGYGSSHGFDPVKSKRGATGFEETFRAKRVGVFLLTATWLLRDSDHDTVTSNPVVLIVSPRFGIDGRAIVTPESRSFSDEDEQASDEYLYSEELEDWKEVWEPYK